jgi:hypothetical protein
MLLLPSLDDQAIYLQFKDNFEYLQTGTGSAHGSDSQIQIEIGLFQIHHPSHFCFICLVHPLTE